jgi:hypothetical protein
MNIRRNKLNRSWNIYQKFVKRKFLNFTDEHFSKTVLWKMHKRAVLRIRIQIRLDPEVFKSRIRILSKIVRIHNTAKECVFTLRRKNFPKFYRN